MAVANGKYGDGTGDAAISPCGTYRYHLTRTWLEGAGRVCFVMLNPSTADATKDDPTIRRCIGFARDWGFNGLDVVNLWAWRSPSPRELVAELKRSASAAHIRGPDNDDTVCEVARSCNTIVFAWGLAPRPLRRETMFQFLQPLGKPIYCLGYNKDGSPKHPLYVPKSQPLIDYTTGKVVPHDQL